MIDARRGLTATLLVAIALTTAVAGCGDSGDDSAASQTANTPADDKAQIGSLMRNLRRDYNRTDGQAFCAALTDKGVAEMEKWAETLPKLPPECADFVKSFAAAFVNSGSGQTPVEVKKVTVKGDRGTIKMRGGLAGIRSTATYQVARVDGEWKLTNPVSGAETRRIEKGDGKLPANLR